MVIIIGLVTLLCWILIGCRLKRYVTGVYIGLIWMFLPLNFFDIIVNDSIESQICMAAVPMLMYLCFEYINTKTKVLPVLIFGSMLILRQIDAYSAAVVSICIVLILFLWKSVNRDKHGVVAPGIALLLPDAVTIYQSAVNEEFYYKNFVASDNSVFFSVKDVLNPVYNFKNAQLIYYFGIAIILLAIFGVICSHRKTNIIFLCGIVLFLFVVKPLSVWFVKQSGYRSDRLYVLLILAYTCIFMAFIMWDTLKVKLQIAVCILLCIDMVPAIYIAYQKKDSAVIVSDDSVSDSILHEAQRLTKHKMIVAGKTDGSKIADDAAEAMDLGEYLYVFDRCLASEYDTVVIQKSKMRNKDSDMQTVKKAAKKENYKFVASNEKYVLFNQEECKEKAFEVKSVYKAIGIGDNVHQLAMIYPQIYEGTENNIEKYSVSELSKYDMVYLSGFTYDDKDAAEKIVRDTAKKGTKIVINADHMPYDKITRNMVFLGVSCNSISFENGYPNLIIDNKEVVTELFDSNYQDWQGVYINGLKKVKGYFTEDGKNIAFLGSLDDNINFVGIELISHYAMTYDDTLKKCIDSMLGLKQEDAPLHEIVIKNK